MNESKRAGAALARTELTEPENRTAKPTTNIATAASQAFRDASVPRTTKHAPTAPRDAWAWTRPASGPEKSTSSSSAKDPKAANVATLASLSTLSPKAKSTGMMRAARVARLSAR